MTKVTFELDGKQVEANPGETIWQVASNPLVCVLKYFPEELKKPLGSW